MHIKNVLKHLNQQKNALISKIPELTHSFIDIYVPKLKTYLPFLPIRCFRDYDLYHSDNLLPKHTTFISSGSTNSIRAQHHFSKNGIDIFAHYTCLGLEKFLKRQNLKNFIIISLIPPPSVWKNSSLSTMIEMFEIYGFEIKWCDIEANYTIHDNSETVCSNFLKILKMIPENTNVIVFGTTFHHLNLIKIFENSKYTQEKNDAFKKFNISIIDTGGTKGKTQFYTLTETKIIFNSFYVSNIKPQFFSEYGMCELSSQAWSENGDHDGTFIANDTLIPYTIDLRNRKIMASSKMGFIGFIDFANVNSYSAIITEDLGSIVGPKKRSFKLFSRAPDASIKGCSLNVTAFSSIASEIIPLPIHHKNVSKVKKFPFVKFLNQLNKNLWDKYARTDFKKSFASLKTLSLTALDLQNLDFKDKNILLISAANTPISFVYPLILTALNGAKSFTLKIPSLRPNDPLSEQIREQIQDLYLNLSQYFPNTDFFLSTSKSIENNFSHYDCVFIFGTDETLKIIKSQCSSNTTFLGFGDIKNSFVVDTQIHSPKFLSEICTVWNGRGCLTPVCLFIDSKRSEHYVLSFFESYKNDMKNRLKRIKNLPFHEHNLLFIESQLKQYSAFNSAKILRAKFVTVIDLSQISPETIKQMKIDFSFGGVGFVYLLPLEMINAFPILSREHVFPELKIK